MSKEGFDKEIDKIEKTIKVIRFFAWLFVAIGFVFLIIGLYYWVKDKELFNEVGDFVGGIAGSLWALAGLFFIYLAFLGQKIEIKYQRQELEESRKVFKQQADIMLEQQLASTFFNLLDNHRKVVSSFRTEIKTNQTIILGHGGDYDTKVLSGYDALENNLGRLKWYLKKYSNFLKNRNIFDSRITRSNPISQIKQYKNIDVLYNEVSGIVEFILKKIREENRKFYLDILYNNLSKQEKFLLTAYNINLSANFLKELNFENYLKYNFRDFSKEEPFIKKTNVFFKVDKSNNDDREFKLKIFDEYPECYQKFNLYLINDDKKLITHVRTITKNNLENFTNDIIEGIARENFPEILKEVEDRKINEMSYLLLLQVENSKYTFSFHSICKIRLQFENDEFKLYDDYYGDKFPEWIEDHFNNLKSK